MSSPELLRSLRFMYPLKYYHSPCFISILNETPKFRLMTADRSRSGARSEKLSLNLFAKKPG